MKDYKSINKNAWNIKTQVHINSEFYNNEAFLKGQNTLKGIELELLGNIKGKSVLHLQCHFGQDSISLARLGAEVTAVDLSDKSIEMARKFSEETQTPVNFICSDIYELPEHLKETFDIVFTSYGVIGWLPDLEKWAKVIAHFLKPGGKFVFVEFHPVVWMFDDDFTHVAYNYFNSGEIEEIIEGSYAEREAEVQYETVSWNHSMSEIINSLIKAGISIDSLEEFDYSPYNCFNNTIRIAPDRYRIESLEDKIPMTFSLTGTKQK